MIRLILVIFYLLLTFINYYLPNIITDSGKWIIFTLICVHFLKELNWIIIKKNCQNSKDKICKLFQKTDQKIINDKKCSKSRDIVKIEKKKTFKKLFFIFKKLMNFFKNRYLELTRDVD